MTKEEVIKELNEALNAWDARCKEINEKGNSVILDNKITPIGFVGAGYECLDDYTLQFYARTEGDTVYILFAVNKYETVSTYDGDYDVISAIGLRISDSKDILDSNDCVIYEKFEKLERDTSWRSRRN